MEQSEHALTIEQQKKLTATAIESVDSFSDRQMVLSCKENRIVIVGEGLKILQFSKTSGAFSAVGQINSVKYTAKGINFAKKIFK